MTVAKLAGVVIRRNDIRFSVEELFQLATRMEARSIRCATETESDRLHVASGK
jgi:hypothetical protein